MPVGGVDDLPVGLAQEHVSLGDLGQGEDIRPKAFGADVHPLGAIAGGKLTDKLRRVLQGIHLGVQSVAVAEGGKAGPQQQKGGQDQTGYQGKLTAVSRPHCAVTSNL